MAAILLLTEEQVRARMSIPSVLSGATDTIESAISAAQHFIEALYDTTLPMKVTECLFLIDGDAFSGCAPDGMHRLLLSDGFVKASPAPQVFWGDTFSTCTNAIPAGEYLLDKPRGIVKVAQSYSDKYVKVIVTTGFASAADTVPSWLQESILGYVPRAFDWGLKNDSDSDPKTAQKASADHGAAVISRWTRNIGMCHRPMHSA